MRSVLAAELLQARRLRGLAISLVAAAAIAVVGTYLALNTTIGAGAGSPSGPLHSAGAAGGVAGGITGPTIVFLGALSAAVVAQRLGSEYRDGTWRPQVLMHPRRRSLMAG